MKTINANGERTTETKTRTGNENGTRGTKTINELIEAESELLSVNVNYYSARKDYILNYFNIKALEGTILDLFEEYLPNFN